MTSIYIPSRRGDGAALDTAYLNTHYATKPEFRSAVQSLEETNTHHEHAILALESQISTGGLKVWDNATTYAKDQIVIQGEGSTARFYRSLSDGNVGNDPATEDTAWALQAGDFRSPLSGDLTGFTDSSVVASVGGAEAADIAAVTTAITAGTLDHPTAVTIGETAAVVNVGTGPNAKIINLGGAGDTVAITGTLATIDTTNLQVADSLIRVNKGGTAGSGGDAGLEIEEDGEVTGYIKTNASRNGFVLKAPAAAEIALNQSMATSSSPSFQALSTASHLQAGGYLRAQSFTNPIGAGSYFAHGSGGMPGATMFLNQPGSADGGWRWSVYGSSNNWMADAMSLTRSGVLTASGYVNSAGLLSSKGLSVNNWDSDAVTTNLAFIGRNRTGATGRMSFGCNRGGGNGGFDWVSYNSSGEEGVPMTLTRQGDLSVTGSITAPAATINGNLTVTGTISGLNLVQSTQTLTGSWAGGVSPMASNIKATRFGPMVTLTFSGFDGPLTSSTVLLNYTQTLPAAYRPPAGSGGFRSMIQFDNGASIRFVNLHVMDTGSFVIHSPNLTWSTTNNAVLLNGTTVTYMV